MGYNLRSMPGVHVVSHPLVQHKLTLMRRESTSVNQFRQLLEEISMLLAYEVTRDFPLSTERIETLVARVEDEGPPPGVPVQGLHLLYDRTQATAVVLQFFDSEADLRAGGQAFAAMDASDTPGTRVSVDTCELKLERRV